MLKSRLMLLVPSVALVLGCQSDRAANEALGIDPQTGVDTAARPGAPGAQDQRPQETVEMQRVNLLVDHYLEEARKLRVEGKLDEAKAFALRARDLKPQDPRTLEMLNQISAEQGEGAGTVNTFAEQQARLAMIREERARAATSG
jgi:hypothetical protein